MAYLLGMITGNGTIRRGSTESIVFIDIPHKKLVIDAIKEVDIYVKASLADIRNTLEPLIGVGIAHTQSKSSTVLSFSKPNGDLVIREIMRFIGHASSHNSVRIDTAVFSFAHDEKIAFLRGFADVTGYIRRSNFFFKKYKHRVYLEVPNNWELVADICNLLKAVDIPVQNIDWAHPNIRDGNLTKYNQGQPNFWKKEHQIKIWANEFEPVGFGIIHKKRNLDEYAQELVQGILDAGENVRDKTHKYYWDGRNTYRTKQPHPGESDTFIPVSIRGRHYDSWKEIARDLGYVE
jgi:hypothetical protein